MWVVPIKQDGSGKPIRLESGDRSDQPAPLNTRAVFSAVLLTSAVGQWVSLTSHGDCFPQGRYKEILSCGGKGDLRDETFL